MTDEQPVRCTLRFVNYEYRLALRNWKVHARVLCTCMLLTIDLKLLPCNTLAMISSIPNLPALPLSLFVLLYKRNPEGKIFVL